MTIGKNYEFRAEELPEELRTPEMMDRVQEEWEADVAEEISAYGEAGWKRKKDQYRKDFLRAIWTVGL